MHNKALTVDPNSGPVKAVMVKRVIARPRMRLSKMSEKTAATTAIEHAPKKPPKKRHSMMVWRSFAVATANWKIVNPNIAMSIGRRRPRNSENGAHRIGPVAKPSTYRDKPKVPTSLET